MPLAATWRTLPLLGLLILVFLKMLTVCHTTVISFLGSAFTVIAMEQSARDWALLDRTLDGPRNWQRFGGLFHKTDSVVYSIRLHATPSPIECVTIWLEFCSETNGGQLTIHLPQTIGPSNVPPGTKVEILNRKWVSAKEATIRRPEWHPDLLEYDSGCVFRSDSAFKKPDSRNED